MTKKTYNKQGNKYVNLLKKTKIIKHTIWIWTWKTIDDKKFWKTVKIFFSDKSNNFENISLIENGKLLTNDFEFGETFNKYFQNLVPNLDFKVLKNLLCQTPENRGEVLAAIFN